MKILQISHRVPYPLNEGGTIGIYNYTRGFSEAGCTVTLFALSARKHAMPEHEIRAALEPYCELHLFPINTDIKPIAALRSLLKGSSYNVDRFVHGEFMAALEKELTSTKYDLIQIEGTYAAPYGELALKLGDCPVVLRQHNVEFQIWERIASNTRNPLKRWYVNVLAERLREFESRHLNQYDAIVPVTENDAVLFEELGCTVPIFPSPAGIDTTYWSPNPDSESSNKLYHLGSLEWTPNVDAVNWFLQKVWPKIRTQNPELSFHIAGKGMDASWKSREVPGVIMEGEVEDAAEFVKDKACCIVPLRSGSGIRLKILEAMCAGKAVVSTSIGAQGIHFIDGEHLCVADTPEQMVAVVSDLFRNREKLIRMQKAAHNLIREVYGNAEVIDRLLKFYQELIRSRYLKMELTER
ncbi:MAG: glycosyltransferase [Flavobacteriales bacterium]|nr:glycosyltransferase [Flavobacteriales bacterium]